jgi:hypothetical protein
MDVMNSVAVNGPVTNGPRSLRVRSMSLNNKALCDILNEIQLCPSEMSEGTLRCLPPTSETIQTKPFPIRGTIIVLHIDFPCNVLELGRLHYNPPPVQRQLNFRACLKFDQLSRLLGSSKLLHLCRFFCIFLPNICSFTSAQLDRKQNFESKIIQFIFSFSFLLSAIIFLFCANWIEKV